MRASIRDIAERAGVSAVTVSNVLRGNASKASEETRTKVLRIAAELQYVPVAQPAVQSRRMETHVIGLVFDGMEIEGYWGAHTYKGLRLGGEQYGYDLLTIVRERHPWMEGTGRGFLDRRCDGLIFITPHNRYETLTTLVDNEIPVVCCFSGEVPPGVVVQSLDNAEAMRLAVREFAKLGHRKIGFFSVYHERTDFTERMRGFKEEVAARGLEGHILLSKEADWQADIIRAVEEDGITAIACSNDCQALRTLDIARQRGWSVPGDLSVSGMDDLADAARKGLTTVGFSTEEVGRGAVESIVRMIQGEKVAAVNAVPVQWIQRESVGPPNSQ